MPTIEALRVSVQDMDIAALLVDFTRRRQGVGASDDTRARCLHQLSLCIGELLGPSAVAVRGVRGFRGYQAAAAKFAEAHAFRSVGVRWLLTGIIKGDVDLVKRWRWTVQTYCDAVLRFAEARKLQMENVPLSRDIAEELAASAVGNYPAHLASVNCRQFALKSVSRDRPDTARFLLLRLRGLIASVEQREKRVSRLAVERDHWRQRAEAAECSVAELRRVRRLPSLQLQVDAYQRAVSKSLRAKALRIAEETCEEVAVAAAGLRFFDREGAMRHLREAMQRVPRGDTARGDT